MYKVAYKTKRGGSGAMTTDDFALVNKKVQSLFRQRLEATIYKDDEVIGKIWKDKTQTPQWNYSLSQ